MRSRVIPTEMATGLVLTFSASCAVTIAATRAFLALTGYPQVGGSVFHLAHARWGGLLLTITTVLLLTIANRWVAPTCAVLGGVGAGLFVDEIGKFITQRNDYFFPLAASIVYLFLLALAATTWWFSQIARTSPQAHVHAALQLADELSDDIITPSQAERIQAHLDAVRSLTTQTSTLAVVDGLQRALDTATPKPRAVPRVFAGLQKSAEAVQAWFTDTRLRRTLLILFTVQAVGGLITGVVMLAGTFMDIKAVPGVVNEVPVGGLATFLAGVSAVVAGVAGAGSLVAAPALTRRHLDPARAARIGGTAMVILLTVGNSLAAYIDQFAVLADAAMQGTILALVLVWARRQKPSPEDTPAVGDVAA